MKKVLGYFASSLLGGLLVATVAVPYFSSNEPAKAYTAAPVQKVNYHFAAPTAGNDGIDFRSAASKTVNAVVHVKTEITSKQTYNPWMEFFGQGSQPRVQMASGSGVIISNDGYIVTNNHVIHGATKIEVSLNDNRSFEAKIIGTDPATDIALIKINEKDLPIIEFGNSDVLEVGEWVLAVGNPFDLTSTVTAGIVSAKARNINLLHPNSAGDFFPVESFIQTDAAVNPGNSGGALVNVSGELVGINTAIASRTGSFSGYSFAVPVSIVQKVAKDLKEFGEVQRAYIGVQITDVNNEIAKEVALKDISGIYVRGVVENGAAQKANMKTGDVILKVNQKMVKNVPELQEEVNRYRPGDKIEVTIWRDGKEKNISVELRNKDGNTMLKEAGSANVKSMLGASLADLNENEKSALGLSNGVQVESIGEGKLKHSGMQEKFIILSVDGQIVSNTSELERILSTKKGGVLLEGIYPDGVKAYYGFGL